MTRPESFCTTLDDARQGGKTLITFNTTYAPGGMGAPNPKWEQTLLVHLLLGRARVAERAAWRAGRVDLNDHGDGLYRCSLVTEGITLGRKKPQARAVLGPGSGRRHAHNGCVL